MDRLVVRDHATGQTVAWRDGTFNGAPDLAERAQLMAEQPAVVHINGIDYWPDAHSRAGAAVAMLAACRGTGTLLTPQPLSAARATDAA